MLLVKLVVTLKGSMESTSAVDRHHLLESPSLKDLRHDLSTMCDPQDKELAAEVLRGLQ